VSPSRGPDRSKLKLVVIYAGLLAFNGGAWMWAITAFGDRPVLLGIALLAYSFGLRHAFDADHIAAIDNVVRKLVQERRRPYTVGLFFSLGHSTVVVVASLLVALTAAGVNARLERLHVTGGVIGTVVSAGFLLAVGFANLLVLKDIWGAFLRVRRGDQVTETEVDTVGAGSGLMTRVLRRTFALVSRSWHLYPVGVLFGLGFDTATEIGVLGISAAQATHQASLWTILIFPTLFTAGMSLVDFTDSVLMTKAYGWAAIHPLRKLWYNLTITATSVLVAVVIGGLEALGLLADKMGLTGSVWTLIQHLNGELGLLGGGIVVFFVLSWLVSFLVFKLKGYDQLSRPPGRTAGA
jgi:high-affinity nickel-transport protein